MILAYAVRWIPATLGGAAFTVPLSSHCQHHASLSSPFFRIPKKFFRTLPGMVPGPGKVDTTSRKIVLTDSRVEVKRFFQIFSHFYLQLFQVLMHISRIFFQSSMIPASYAFPVVLNCNACAYMCGLVRETCICLKMGQK